MAVTDPAFVVERFGLKGDRLEVAGHWHGLRGRRFVRPVLWLHHGEARRRLVAVLDHKPWAADDGDPWMAAFAWDGGTLEADRVELEVGRELVVELPLPGRKAPPRAPARPRQPSELERARDELSAATRERRALQAALDTATTDAGQLQRLRAERDEAVAAAERARAERDRALEAAERARADGERLVNDEYRQREHAQEFADRSAERARETQAALELAQRQLTAARTSYASLEADRDEARRQRDAAMGRMEVAERARDDVRERLEAAERQRDEARERLAVAMAEGDQLRERVEAAAAERERLLGATVEHDVLAEIEAPADQASRDGEERAERQRLEAELAGAWADREQLVADLAAARAGRERVEAELVAARSDRKRLERELAGRVEPEPPRPTVRVSPFTQSRTAPPSSAGGLWVLRLLALAMVVALLAAAVVLLTGVL